MRSLLFLLDPLFPPRVDERIIRELSADAFCAAIAPTLLPATRPAALGLTPFTDPVVRAAIHEAKYHGSAHAFRLLAALLADVLPDYLAEHFGAYVGRPTSHIRLVPIPLGRTRRRERGYNQVEEVLLKALPALRNTLGPEVAIETTLLMRVRETATQVSLARKEREENMRGAFAASAPQVRAPARDSRALYILLDDVMTTGATLGAGVEALVEGGLEREQILPLALAYQP